MRLSPFPRLTLPALPRIVAAGLLGLLLTLPSLERGLAETTQSDWSPAQKAVFGTSHLENIAQPTTLHYAFHRSGSGRPAFEDKVEMTVTDVMDDGTRNLAFQFFSGARAAPVGAIEGFRGNPLIMLYLQWDVTEMKDVVGGATRYLRNKIRYAFYEGAEMEETTIELDGKSLPATRIRLRPFLGDSHRDQLGPYQQKLYEILLSPEVPGGLYRIRTLVPSDKADEPVVEDDLVFAGVAP
jgi:hypothetical protein